MKTKCSIFATCPYKREEDVTHFQYTEAWYKHPSSKEDWRYRNKGGDQAKPETIDSPTLDLYVSDLVGSTWLFQLSALIAHDLGIPSLLGSSFQLKLPLPTHSFMHFPSSKESQAGNMTLAIIS